MYNELPFGIVHIQFNISNVPKALLTYALYTSPKDPLPISSNELNRAPVASARPLKSTIFSPTTSSIKSSYKKERKKNNQFIKHTFPLKRPGHIQASQYKRKQSF